MRWCSPRRDRSINLVAQSWGLANLRPATAFCSTGSASFKHRTGSGWPAPGAHIDVCPLDPEGRVDLSAADRS
jgi:hypothetical protein